MLGRMLGSTDRKVNPKCSCFQAIRGVKGREMSREINWNVQYTKYAEQMIKEITALIPR